MTDSVIDTAAAVRPGEELNTPAVDRWLKQHVDAVQGKPLQGSPKVTQYSGGASNWTYCLSYENCELILRRAPAGTKAKGAHNMQREYNLQKILKPVYRYVPQALAYCADESVTGSDFYVMEKLVGVIPRKNMPRGMELDEATVGTLCKNALDSLIALHKVDYKAAGLSELGKGEGYIARQIEGWSQRYRDAKTWNVSEARQVIEWLERNQPSREIICITHNDFRFDNLVLDPNDPTQINGVLDWELATLGDPLMDLGNSLAYWVEPGDDFLARNTRRQPTHLPGMMTRQQVVDYYLGQTGFEVDSFTFYEVYGLFRLAGIAQQIYYRYHHKQTDNPAFKGFWLFVNYLIWRCHRAIKQEGKK